MSAHSVKSLLLRSVPGMRAQTSDSSDKTLHEPAGESIMILRPSSLSGRRCRPVSLLDYFRFPFPSAKGFSAYRSPGGAVHAPLILAVSVAGFLLCWPHAMLRPLLLIWLLAGLYLGREVTILCHYNPLLTLMAWGGSALVLFRPAPIANFGRSHTVAVGALTAAVGTLLLGVALMATQQRDSSPPSSSSASSASGQG